MGNKFQSVSDLDSLNVFPRSRAVANVFLSSSKFLSDRIGVRVSSLYFLLC